MTKFLIHDFGLLVKPINKFRGYLDALVVHVVAIHLRPPPHLNCVYGMRGAVKNARRRRPSAFIVAILTGLMPGITIEYIFYLNLVHCLTRSCSRRASGGWQKRTKPAGLELMIS